MSPLQFVATATLLGLWGLYLLYVWFVPAEVPRWAPRRLLMLSTHHEPTIFTLIFGVIFCGCLVAACVRLWTGGIETEN